MRRLAAIVAAAMALSMMGASPSQAAGCDGMASVSNQTQQGQIASSVEINGWSNGCNNASVILTPGQTSASTFDSEFIRTPTQRWGLTVERYQNGVVTSRSTLTYANSRGDGYHALADDESLYIITTAVDLWAPTASSGPSLTWAPPAGYTSFPARSPTSSTSLNVVDGGGGDVWIKLPTDRSIAPITIRNCRNAVLIGGSIKVLPVQELNGNDQRAVYVTGCSGTVHLEGLYIEGDVAGSAADAIAINAPNAIVQMQNIHANAMRGTSGNHADVVQPWGGVREYRIDRMTGSTNYQGLHVGEPTGKVIGRGTIRNANIYSSGVQPDGKAGHYLWLPHANQYPVLLENVFIGPRPGDTLNRAVYPGNSISSCRQSLSGSGSAPSDTTPAVATWPGCAWITGKVTQGRPFAGDFVPASSVGLGYTSPGYQ